jgi:lysozyme
MGFREVTRFSREGAQMGVNNLTYGADGLALTEQFEGCELTAYQDVKGVWTIGVGHTGADVVPGLTITQAQAQALLANDVSSAVACVNNVVAVPLSQQQFDALVDFVFNVGAGAFETSTLLKNLNAGDFAGTAAQFDVWDHAGPVVVPGLLRRRQAETALFNSGPSGPQNT